MKLPTEDKIRAMGKGPEMDLLIAEHVIGHDNVWIGGGRVHHCDVDNNDQRCFVRAYSGNTNDAVVAATYMTRPDGMCWELTNDIGDNKHGYLCCIFRECPKGVSSAVADTPALALCRALLLWRVYHETTN